MASKPGKSVQELIVAEHTNKEGLEINFQNPPGLHVIYNLD